MKQQDTWLIVGVIGVAAYLIWHHTAQAKLPTPKPPGSNQDMGGTDFGVTNPDDWGG